MTNHAALVNALTEDVYLGHISAEDARLVVRLVNERHPDDRMDPAILHRMRVSFAENRRPRGLVSVVAWAEEMVR